MNCVVLDGDWCWGATPLIVNEETKSRVGDNISHLLHNFLACSAYENILFCWVMQEECIMEKVLSLIQGKAYTLHRFSLVYAENALRSRLQKDIDNGVREKEIGERALQRLPNYLAMNATQIDVSEITPDQAAHIMLSHMYPAG